MVKHKRKSLLSLRDTSPSDPKMKVVGVFNPGAVRFGDEIILLVRVAETPIDGERGVLSSPRATLTGLPPRFEVDHLPIVAFDDLRKPLIAGGRRRLAYVSHLEVARLSSDGFTVKSLEKVDQLFPQEEYEEYGLEDPRIIQTGNTFYITYVAVSYKMQIVTCLASTTDFVHFTRHGIIFPFDTKDVVILPEKVSGRYLAYLRPYGHINLNSPSIISAKSDDLLAWGDYDYLMNVPENRLEVEKIGMGAPLYKTDRGWLAIYHSVSKTNNQDAVGIYQAEAALFDLNDPTRLLARSKKAILSPEESFERDGFVPNVIFPSGIVSGQSADSILLYYGAADSSVAVVELSISELIRSCED